MVHMYTCFLLLQIKSYPRSSAVLVRNHGVYIWGETWISAKTQVSAVKKEALSLPMYVVMIKLRK